MFKQFMHNFPLQQINHDKNLVEKDTKFKKLNKCQKSPAEQDKILTFHNSPSPPPPPPPLSLWFCRRRTSPFSYRAYAQDKENRISPGVVHKAGSHLVILIDAMKKTGGPNPDSCHSMHIQIIHNSDNRLLSKLLLIRNNQLPIASRNQHEK